MTRLDPFDLVFSEFEQHFKEIQAEVTRTPTLSTFASTSSVGRCLEMFGTGPVTDADTREVEAYLTFLYAAYRFWENGCPRFHVEKTNLQQCIKYESAPSLGNIPRACYVQLPRGWIWGRVADGAPHEPVDGMFVVVDAPKSIMTIVAILGLREERGGFSQLVSHANSDEMAAASHHVRRPLFAPVLEGGAQAGFLSVVSEAELLLLTSLALHSVNG